MQTGQSEHSIYLTVSMRKRMFQQQLKESLVYAAGISFIIILMATFTGWIFSRNLINWDTMESVYFGQTGNVVKSHFYPWSSLSG